MELRILHTTTYRYQGSVDMAQHMVHLSPLDTATQTIRAHMLTVTPEPASRSQTTDAFGNLRTFFSLQSPHETLTVTADSTVVTQAPASLPDHPTWQAQTWESVRARFHYRARAPYDPASEFLFASPHVPRDGAFAEFARTDFVPGRSMLACVRSLMEHIHSGLTYDSTSTEVNTPALVAMAQRKGVCQDFAHILVACLRSLGLPGRYVSGYLLTQPPPGQPRLIGADASHAWAQVYLPEVEARHPGQGWYDLDPTNEREGWGTPGEDFVTVAQGRDYGDVAPMRGVIHGGASHTLQVAVTVQPVGELLI